MQTILRLARHTVLAVTLAASAALTVGVATATLAPSTAYAQGDALITQINTTSTRLGKLFTVVRNFCYGLAVLALFVLIFGAWGGRFNTKHLGQWALGTALLAGAGLLIDYFVDTGTGGGSDINTIAPDQLR